MHTFSSALIWVFGLRFDFDCMVLVCFGVFRIGGLVGLVLVVLTLIVNVATCGVLGSYSLFWV